MENVSVSECFQGNASSLLCLFKLLDLEQVMQQIETGQESESKCLREFCGVVPSIVGIIYASEYNENNLPEGIEVQISLTYLVTLYL